MGSFDDGAFDIGDSADLNSLGFNVSKRVILEFLSFIRVHPDWTPPYRFQIFGIIKDSLKCCRDSFTRLRS